MSRIYLLIAIGSVINGAVSQVLLKMGAQKKYDSKIREYINPYVIVGYGMLFISMVLTIVAYKELSYLSVPVIEALGYVLVPFLSCLIFREKIGKKKLGGFLLILAGIFLYYT